MRLSSTLSVVAFVATSLACETEQNKPGAPDAVVDAAGSDADEASEWSLEAAPGDGAVRLAWTAPEAVSGAPVRVHYRVALPGPPWDGVGSLAGDSPLDAGNEAALTLAGLANGVAHYFAVSAVVAGQDAAMSAWVKATPRRDGTAQVFVPAGVFTMGATPFVHESDEEPAHPVYLDSFWLDRYVATNLEYRECVEAQACAPPSKISGFLPGVTKVEDYFTNPAYDDFPVVNLAYADAQAYCAFRNKRLPTEAEWEKAARGTETPMRPHPWGSAPPSCELANYNDDGFFCVGGPKPVGTYAGVNESPYGAAEMAGNVWQWTADWYEPYYYENSPCRNPKGPEIGIDRCLRGGAWYYPVGALSTTYRNHWRPILLATGGEFGDYQGFGVRCAQSASEVPCDPATAQCELPDDAVCPDDPVSDPDATDSDIAEPDGTPIGDAHDASGDGDSLDTSDSEGGPADVTELDTLSDAAPSDTSGDSGGEDAGPPPQDTGAIDGGPEDASSPDTNEPDAGPPCGWPQDLPTNIGACYDAQPPMCPSGWPLGCELLFCACALNITAEPNPCAEEVMDLTLGWRDGQKVFHPFAEKQEYEMCQGFQGGFHMAVFIEVEDSGLASGAANFYPDLHVLASINGVKVGGASTKKSLFQLQPNGKYRSQLIQVVWESCNANFFVGTEVLIEVLLRVGDKYGKAKIKLEPVDKYNGPYLSANGEDPC
jgi:formylglycine-generating enzyme required for sulfatase activity